MSDFMTKVIRAWVRSLSGQNQKDKLVMYSFYNMARRDAIELQIGEP